MVIIYSLLLIIGIVAGQVFNLAAFSNLITFIASVCLAYIMTEVGLEFSLEQRPVRSYGKDFVIAASAAILPALLWVGYFTFCVNSDWKSALLSGLSSAPTSAGVLFSMMMAAGLAGTWVYKKAQVLAILDDLVTIMLLMPLQVIMFGLHWHTVLSLTLTILFLFCSFRFPNTIKWHISRKWLLIYGVGVAAVVFLFTELTHTHIGVLMPAFMLGCLLKHHDHEIKGPTALDYFVKGLFMLLVGLTFPKIGTGEISFQQTAIHIVALTLLANLGKFFLVLCYKREASFKERLALGIAMFPRGEVGAAVLLIGISYGLAGYANSLAVLSLALNLILTGLFIWLVIRLLKA